MGYFAREVDRRHKTIQNYWKKRKAAVTESLEPQPPTHSVIYCELLMRFLRWPHGAVPTLITVKFMNNLKKNTISWYNARNES